MPKGIGQSERIVAVLRDLLCSSETDNFKNMIDNKKETKTCPYCAEKIKIEAIKCKHCGSGLEEKSNDEQITKASRHSSYGTFTIIAILLPIVGIILGIAYLSKDSQVDKKLGEHILATSILFMIIWPILWFIF